MQEDYTLKDSNSLEYVWTVRDDTYSETRGYILPPPIMNIVFNYSVNNYEDAYMLGNIRIRKLNQSYQGHLDKLNVNYKDAPKKYAPGGKKFFLLQDGSDNFHKILSLYKKLVSYEREDTPSVYIRDKLGFFLWSGIFLATEMAWIHGRGAGGRLVVIEFGKKMFLLADVYIKKKEGTTFLVREVKSYRHACEILDGNTKDSFPVRGLHPYFSTAMLMLPNLKSLDLRNYNGSRDFFNTDVFLNLEALELREMGEIGIDGIGASMLRNIKHLTVRKIKSSDVPVIEKLQSLEKLTVHEQERKMFGVCKFSIEPIDC